MPQIRVKMAALGNPTTSTRNMNSFTLVSASVTPVVLISACGLIASALYSRLGAILFRIREFHQQKIELLERMSDHDAPLLAMIDLQISGVTAKGKMIQQGLFWLLSSIVAFLLCSLLTAVSVLHAPAAVFALTLLAVGLVLFLFGIGCAIRELVLSIAPLDEETRFLEALTAHRKRVRGSRMRRSA